MNAQQTRARWRVGALVVTGALLLTGCRPPGAVGAGAAAGTSGASTARTASGNNLDATPSKTAPTTVKVVTASSGSLNAKRSVSATISAARDSNVAAQTGGTVSAVLAQEGDQVQAGQVIVKLDDTSLRQSVQSAQLSLQNARINLQQGQRNTGLSGPQLQAAVAAARTNLVKAQAAQRTNEQLFALGGVSKADLQTSTATLAQAQADLASAQNNLAQNGQSGSGSIALLQNQVATAENALAQAQDNLAKANIRAPFSGTLGDVPAQVGASLASGATAFRLVDPNTLRADFKVPPSDVNALKAGTLVNVVYQGSHSTGRIVSSNSVAGSDRLVPLKARISQADIPVGAVAQVSYNVSLGGGVLLPTTAVQTDDDTTSVFVVEGGQARQVSVTILAESGGRVAVRGPESGQSVVNPIPSGLQDGASVQVQRATSGTPQGGTR